MAQYSQTAYGVGVSSGTDALLNSLMSLDIGPGDLVLTTPYTFFATMGTILRVGAKPLFVDVTPKSLNMDPALAAEALKADRAGDSRIKAMIPVHLYGQCADMQPIMALSKEYGVPVIEDAAQAIGAEYPFEEQGTITWRRAGGMGIAGCFSFFPSKNLGGIGDGGMITTSDERPTRVSCAPTVTTEPNLNITTHGLAAISALILFRRLFSLSNWTILKTGMLVVVRMRPPTLGFSQRLAWSMSRLCCLRPCMPRLQVQSNIITTSTISLSFMCLNAMSCANFCRTILLVVRFTIRFASISRNVLQSLDTVPRVFRLLRLLLPIHSRCRFILS